ncbi:uncharacterized protein LOC141591503 [Silene latifolia]|uniref:uncharacterized protein LOC141591503 n=1 Tax=Silene latifolia TaxID=37657 RepID=UPI003D775C9C
MADDFALLSSRLKLNSFDDETLQILDRMIFSPDINEFQKIRTNAVQFVSSKFLTVIRQYADKPVEVQLSTFDFFIRAFETLNETQSCWSLKFEKLVIRDSNAASQPNLHVTCEEWLKFAEDVSDYGLYCIASEACEYARSCLDRNGGDGDHDKFIDRINRLKDAALPNHLGNEDNICDILEEDVSDGCDVHTSEDNEEETGQVSRKQKTKKRKTKKKKKNRGIGKKFCFTIDKYVLEVCRELDEKKLFMVYNAVVILGLPAFQSLVERVRKIQADGGQKTYAGERLKKGGGILWSLLRKENNFAYRVLAERERQLKCDVVFVGIDCRVLKLAQVMISTMCLECLEPELSP